VTYFKGRVPRFVTVCDRGGVKSYVMDNLCFKRVQLHKYNILMFNKF